MIGIRKSLDFLFSRRELKILDDIMPETTKRTEEERRQLEGEVRLCPLRFRFWNLEK
jgi:sodium bicarbonate transporter 10